MDKNEPQEENPLITNLMFENSDTKEDVKTQDDNEKKEEDETNWQISFEVRDR